MSQRTHDQVALVTTTNALLRKTDLDIEPITRGLAEVGVSPTLVGWDDESVDWSRFDLVVMRSPWDYSDRADEFTSWLNATGDVVPVLNCPHLISWNLDKRYLAELADHGVATVPTFYAEDAAELETAFASLNAESVVVKPTVSAGSRDTGMFTRDDEAAVELARRILAAGKTVMLQPAIASVATEGEHALLYFNGEFSHAIRKGPLLRHGGGLIGGDYREEVSPVAASEQERATSDAALSAIADVVDRLCTCAPAIPLYARIDLVRDADTYLLLEAELFEPSYFTAFVPGAAGRFAAAVSDRLAELQAE